MSPRWQNRSFLTSLPLTRITNNYSRTKHHPENPGTWGVRLKNTVPTLLPALLRPRRTALQGEEKQLLIDHIAPPQASTTPCREVSLEPLAPLVEKKNPGRTTCPTTPSIVCCLVGTSSLISHHADSRGICRA